MGIYRKHVFGVKKLLLESKVFGGIKVVKCESIEHEHPGKSVSY